jgi:hypothetical protein
MTRPAGAAPGHFSRVRRVSGCGLSRAALHIKKIRVPRCHRELKRGHCQGPEQQSRHYARFLPMGNHAIILACWCNSPEQAPMTVQGPETGPANRMASCRDRVDQGCAWSWPRITTTGQGACCTQCMLTEPSSASAKPPCPRLPTTSRPAPSQASSSTWAG